MFFVAEVSSFWAVCSRCIVASSRRDERKIAQGVSPGTAEEEDEQPRRGGANHRRTSDSRDRLGGTSWLTPWKVTLHLESSKVQELPVHDTNGAKTPEMEPPAGTDAVLEEVAC